MSLCQTCVRQSRNSCWLSGSSQYWSSNVCAALGGQWRTKELLCLDDGHLDWLQRLHNNYHDALFLVLFGEGSWIHFCQLFWSSSSRTCASCWRSSNLFTLAYLGMIIFICIFPWTSMSLSTSTSVATWVQLVRRGCSGTSVRGSNPSGARVQWNEGCAESSVGGSNPYEME